MEGLVVILGRNKDLRFTNNDLRVHPVKFFAPLKVD